jgi:signal transduction histidine kinase
VTKLRRTIFATGALALLAGVGILGSTTAIPVSDAAGPLRIAAALGFSFAGVGLLALTRPKDRSRLLARGAAVLLAFLALGGLTVVGLEAVSARPYSITSAPAPHAVLFGSELSLIVFLGLLAIAIALAALTLTGRKRAGASVAASFAVTAGMIGAASLAVAALGLQTDDGDFFDTLLASILFPTIGLGLFCAAKIELKLLSAGRPGPPLDHNLSAATGLCLGLVALSAFVVFSLTGREGEELRQLDKTRRFHEALLATNASTELAREISRSSRALQTEIDIHAAEHIRRRRGAAIVLSVSAVAMSVLLGAIHLLFQRDSVARQRSEAALRRHNDTLKGFAHTVAHDLRAPLRGIAGYASELDAQAHLVDSRGRYCINQINTAAQNLERLIGDTLDYAQLDAETPSLSTIVLPTLVASLLQQRAPEIRQHGTIIDTHFGIITVQSWERGVAQIVGNLLDNALKYSRNAHPPRLRIETAQTPLSWRLAIYDNGVGFDMKYHDRIFGLFQRLVTTDEFEGTGAGLAIVRKITDRLGGTVRAEGKPGGGATFLVELPRIVNPEIT